MMQQATRLTRENISTCFCHIYISTTKETHPNRWHWLRNSNDLTLEGTAVVQRPTKNC